jgi:hypothetical protein
LDAKVDGEVDSVDVKRIGMDDLVSYVYIVRVSDINHFIFFVNCTKWIDDLDAKVNGEVDSVYVKRIGMNDFLGHLNLKNI